VVSARNINWITVAAIVSFHAGAVAALFLCTSQALLIALALLWISGGWGIGMGYHRLLTHRAYQTQKWIEYILAVCGSLALQGGPLFWVSTHRLHHQSADSAGDPHSPHDGLWWSHAGWLVRNGAVESDDLSRLVPDLRRDRFLCAIERWHFVPMIAMACILAVGLALGRSPHGREFPVLGYLPQDHGGVARYVGGQLGRASMGTSPLCDSRRFDQ
jgi:fatty-acid desaturase